MWQQLQMLAMARLLLANASGDPAWEKARQEFLAAHDNTCVLERPIRVDGKHTERCLTIPAFVAKMSKRPGHLEVRVVDVNHPDFWLELEIPDALDPEKEPDTPSPVETLDIVGAGSRVDLQG